MMMACDGIKRHFPKNWESLLTNIKIMRKDRTAPVDSLGCHKCGDQNSEPQIYRFQTLVALLISSQTKDQVTFAAMQRLKEHGLTIQNILKTQPKLIADLLYPVGFYKRKAEYLLRLSELLHEKFNDDIPRDLADLMKLPGIGPKMAHICMKEAWNTVSGIGVDTHVHRISNRLGWTGKGTKSPEETRKSLESWLPVEHWPEINELLVGFGQTICLPLNPKCSQCLNNKICPSSRIKLKRKFDDDIEDLE